MEHLINIFARCDRDCVSERCDDYGADLCADWHTEEEHYEIGHYFCGKMAFLSHGCEICQEMLAIYMEIKDGKTPRRECRECRYLYDLDCSENPYGEVQWDTDTEEVYFECDGCLTLEAKGVDR